MRAFIPAALALPALALSLAAVAAPGDGAAAPSAHATVEHTTAAKSLIAVRDRATGKLRAPTPDGSKLWNLMASAPAAMATSTSSSATSSLPSWFTPASAMT